MNANKKRPVVPRRSKRPNPNRRQIHSEVVRVMRSLTEHKYFDLPVTGTLASFEAAPISLTDVPAGTTDLTRIGDQVTGTSLDLTFSISAVSGATYESLYVRVIVFVWHDDSSPTIFNLLQSNNNLYTILSPFDVDRAPKRHVLCDEHLGPLSYAAVHYSTTPAIIHRRRINLNSLPVSFRRIQYQGATITGIGKIYIAVIARDINFSQTATVPGSWFTLYSRYNYTDM